ncbi:MAG: hypothetical protein RBR03_09080 [Desulfuromonas thiophila]|jgi:hypothetical protein|nr:hypothetical protein [Desulfuromonas thiophila]MDY0398798.1 hypothetical protein [Desulfuromonas thiophila]
MLERFFNWLFGKKVASTIGGIAIGSATSVVVAASTGTTDSAGLITAATVGAAAALSGAGGRGTGEN